MENFIHTFWSNLLQTSLFEYIAVFFGILSPLYSRRENILVYPTGIISVAIYIYLCFSQQIFAEMGINIFYLVMSFYGWWVWKHPKNNQEEKPITKLSAKEWVLNLFITLVYFIIIYYVLKTYTSSNVPIFDAVSTAIFITGMWLMAIKKLENWYAWILGNAIAIPLFAYKNLALSSVYFFILMIIAIFGFISWNKKFKSINV